MGSGGGRRQGREGALEHPPASSPDFPPSAGACAPHLGVDDTDLLAWPQARAIGSWVSLLGIWN